MSSPDKPRNSDTSEGGVTFASKATDLSALRDSVVEAAGVGGGLWFSYLFSLFYLTIATGGVTHRDLLLANPVKLPFLNVDLPLLGFFFIGPLILVLIHVYILLHFVLLANKIGIFHAELHAQIQDDSVRTQLRGQLPSNIFIQFLAGPHDVREGIVGIMLKIIAHISLVYGPIVLLLFFLLCFLPYHSEFITNWQRLLIALDIALVWLLWPRILEARLRLSVRSRLSVLILGGFCSASVVLSLLIATFPGEWLDDNIPTIEVGGTSLHKLLVAGDVDLAERRPKSLWSNRLVVPGIDVLNHEKFDSETKIAALPMTVSLRARHLEGAVLIGANLRKVDFTGAVLSGADLSLADVREANFGCDRFGQDATCADLRGAILSSGNFNGAIFEKANLRGAIIDYASFDGASLKSARMVGVSAVQTQFSAAILDGADFRGALLDVAAFPAASLLGADFRGAAFYGTQLQGANLDLANFDLAIMQRINIWRVRSMPFTDYRIVGKGEPESKPVFFCLQQMQGCDWSASFYTDFEARVKKWNLKSSVINENLKALDPKIEVADEQSTLSAWKDVVSEPDSIVEFDELRSTNLSTVACEESGSPYIIRNFLRARDVYFPVSSGEALAQTLLSPACGAGQGLTSEEKLRLHEMIAGRG
jgi:uncharacterized protein YjbI with pentapeptide repeats